MNVNEILLIFCQYGFRKASMEDIAKAAGLSRQSIYKKFGSKEAVFEWAISEASSSAFDAAMAALFEEKETMSARIVNAFDRWIGDFVPVLRGTPHGTEVLEKAIDYYTGAGHSGEAEFYSAIERQLLSDNLASTAEQASDKAFTLAMTAKGLLLRTDTLEEFHRDMERAIRAISVA